MRLIAIVTAMVLWDFGLAWAQTPTPVQHPYGLDPYKPSDAELLRKYGSVLATRTPLLDLRRLDPYKPSHAALLRALGGALPLWANWCALASPPASLTPGSTPAATSPRDDGRLCSCGLCGADAVGVDSLRRCYGNRCREIPVKLPFEPDNPTPGLVPALQPERSSDP
jgi:hypothetical protein